MELELTNRILRNELFCATLSQIENLEKGRIFCGHSLPHLLDTARIALILCRERGISADADVIYSASLLHDIGRAAQYTDGTPHDEAGCIIAEEILRQVDCDEEKTQEILRLVASHRKGGGEDTVEGIFCIADKKSRLCFACPAQSECNWSINKRNMKIEV
ncbi:MAG: HD domain-containing protein [Ruminococcus sp.]|nr:HD domain-containing protein [Ruminococcus sp.]